MYDHPIDPALSTPGFYEAPDGDLLELTPTRAVTLNTFYPGFFRAPKYEVVVERTNGQRWHWTLDDYQEAVAYRDKLKAIVIKDARARQAAMNHTHQP